MGRTLIVTGASRGIGAATARLAARAGWAVAVNYRDHAEEAQAVVAAIEAAGGRAVAIRADMGEEAEIVALFAAAETALGPLGGLVNNAGYLGGEHSIQDLDVARLRRLLDVNVVAYFVAAREAARRLSTRSGGPGGVIVNVASMAAENGGMAGRVHYATSKGANATFTIGLAKELGPQGIRVAGVLPGVIDTHFNDDFDNEGRNERLGPMIPLRRVGTAEDVAEAIVWLLSDGARYVSGACVRVSGGFYGV
jgi:NAD(P)-dependent dehydrogenase (short-subunit alcohol dehydrogenase family)